MIEAFLPLLHLSKSPRIVNVSSSYGKLSVSTVPQNVILEINQNAVAFFKEKCYLQFLPDGWAKGVLSNGQDITEEKVDEIVKEYLKDFKDGSLERKGWPQQVSAYRVSKAALNGYTRALAKKYPNFCINCVCPGYVKTDFNHSTGFLTIEEGAKGPVMLALLPDGGPTGLFFKGTEESSFD